VTACVAVHEVENEELEAKQALRERAPRTCFHWNAAQASGDKLAIDTGPWCSPCESLQCQVSLSGFGKEGRPGGRKEFSDGWRASLKE
jgi:hypothetical protein